MKLNSKPGYDPVTQDRPEDDSGFPAALLPLSFSSNGFPLIGRFFVASGEGPHPVAILLHGFPGNEQNLDIAHALCRAGWNVLFFHYGGSWGSAGEFSYGRAIEDGLAAIDFVSSDKARKDYRCDPSKLMLVGHSMGGFIALHCAARDSRVSGIVTIGSFNFGAFGEWLLESTDNRKFATEMFRSNILPIRGATAEGLIDSCIQNRSIWNLEGLADRVRKIPILLSYGTRDVISVPDVHHHQLVRALSQNRVASLQERAFDADHMFIQVRLGLTRHILQWAKETLLS